MFIENVCNLEVGDIIEINNEKYEVFQIEETQDTYQETYDYEVIFKKGNDFFLYECTYNYFLEKYSCYNDELIPIRLKPIIKYEYDFLDEEEDNFKDAYIGMEVFNLPNGKGKIIDILQDDIYNLTVKFEDGVTRVYDFSGRENSCDKYPSLFKNEEI